MTPPIDQARRYLSKIDPAISGQSGHNKTYHVACILVNGFGLDVDSARMVMGEYNQLCVPPWTDDEINHKLADADRTPEPKGRGHLLNRNGSVTYKFGQSERQVPKVSPPIRRDEPKSFAGKYEVDPFQDIPPPIADGTRELIMAAFAPGEGIRIAQAVFNDEGREVPKDAGVTLSREEWLRKLDANGGDVNKFMRTSERNGIFVSVNPLKLGCSKDSDVLSFRHCLLEWDSFSIEEQYSLIKQSNIPCTAIILSGGKSVHAWVNIDAKDRKEYDERVALVYSHFAEWKPDPKNKNPSRFSRLAGCERGKGRQELLAVKVGAPSFAEWHASLASDGAGQVISILDLMKFKPEEDENSILGNRWLCRGGSCLIVGQSGLGKSSFAVQAAVTWALGRSFFGILPKKPLRSLFIQAENDFGDLAEMVQGVLGPDGLNCTPEELDQVARNVVIVRDVTHSGFEFCRSAQKLIDRHKPDLCWFDPLLSFIGDDISKQNVCSEFLRTWLGPISEATGVCWMMVHHTGKPANDPKSRSKWHSTDFSYSGIGSSELTNWARAVCNLDRVNETTFLLMLSKRGKRAGALDMLGQPTTKVWLKHSAAGIRWEQTAEPPPEKSKRQYSTPGSAAEDGAARGPGKPAKIDELRPYVDEFRGVWGDDECLSLGAAARKLKTFAEFRGIELCEKTAEKIIVILGHEGNLIVNTTHDGFDVSGVPQ